MPAHRTFWPLLSQSIRGDDDCWPWAGSISAKGYARFGGTWAYRLTYELWNGAIPQGYEIDHLCQNRACVNPAHLEAVDHHTNTLRSNNFIAMHARKTHCVNGHELSGENVQVVTQVGRGSRRQCVICARAAKRRYKRKMKAQRAA